MDLIESTWRESLDVKKSLRPLFPDIARAAELLVECYKKGGKALFFGNGGSAADAQHFAAELECHFRFDRPPLPAMALHANTSTLSAISNDYAFDDIFARLLEAHARPGDVAVAISTSGHSANVLRAAALKTKLDIGLIALTGADAEALAPFADVVLAVPSKVTARVQEAHELIGHILCDWVERKLFHTDE
ncbi:MAG: SIS domain-containing protein [Deltaproteobacteria bacterium]|nr:SIS domain-containing protein [Deltaproteobacteria bacterium]